MAVRPLPQLTNFNTISQLHALLLNAECNFVNYKGRKVTIPGYSGDYQLHQVSDRILKVWHSVKLSINDRVDLKSLEKKIETWYGQTHDSAERACCLLSCIDRIRGYGSRNEPEAYLHSHEDNIWLSPLDGVFNRGVDNYGQSIDRWVYPPHKAMYVNDFLFVQLDCDWKWTGQEWDFWHNPYVKLSTAYTEEEWKEEFGNDPMPDDIWSPLTRPVGAIQRKTFKSEECREIRRDLRKRH